MSEIQVEDMNGMNDFNFVQIMRTPVNPISLQGDVPREERQVSLNCLEINHRQQMTPTPDSLA